MNMSTKEAREDFTAARTQLKNQPPNNATVANNSFLTLLLQPRPVDQLEGNPQSASKKLGPAVSEDMY